MKSATLTAATLVLTALGFVGVAFHPPNNIDITWYLIAARTLAAGGEPYVTMRDLNTPPIWYLYLGVQKIAQATGLPSHRVFYLCVALASVGLLASTACILRADSTGRQLQALAVLLVGSYFTGFAALELAGQRDPLVLLLLLPYTAWTQYLAANPPGRRQGIGYAVTSLAGLGLLIKPYYLIWVLLLEALLAWRRRDWLCAWRPDLLWPATACLALAALLLVLHPAYLEHVLTYGAYYAAYPASALSTRAVGGLGLLGLLAAARLVMWRGDRGWSDTVLVGAFGALLAALAQNKWWDYQAAQVETMAGLGLAALAVNCGHAELRARWRRLALAFVALVTISYAVLSGLPAVRQQLRYLRRDVHEPLAEELAAALDRLAAGQSAALLGGWYGPNAAYLSQTRWALKDPSYWVVDQLGELRQAGRPVPALFAAAEQTHRDDVIARLALTAPPLLAFHRGSPGHHVDALIYYKADRRFETLLDFYRPVESAGGYELWLRQDLALPGLSY